MKLKCRIGLILYERELKQNWLADQLDVSNRQVNNWVKGRSYPTVAGLFEVAKILNVKVDDLYEEID